MSDIINMFFLKPQKHMLALSRFRLAKHTDSALQWKRYDSSLLIKQLLSIMLYSVEQTICTQLNLLLSLMHLKVKTMCISSKATLKQ